MAKKIHISPDMTPPRNAADESILPAWARILTWIFRIVAGGVFIFSGFVKAIDPWGTLFKIEDYFAVWGWNLWPTLVLTIAFFLCAVEFMVGVFIVLGCFRRASAWVLTAIMAFMLPLTLWIAIADPVADCGCFGDAYILTNWQTFWKNVLLMLIALWLLRFLRDTKPLVTPALQWLALLATAAFIFVIEFIGYQYQPLIDFRPYPAGTDIAPSGSTDTLPQYKFIYEKDGVKKEFSETDSLPDESDGWTFVDRVEVRAQQPDAPRKETDLTVFSYPDGDEATQEAIDPDSREMILFIPALADVSVASTWKINSLNSWARNHGIRFIAIVAGSDADIARWEDISMPDYDIFTAEDTSIKEIVRGNPAIVYLENGNIRWKSTLNWLPVDDFLSSGTADDPMSFAYDNSSILKNALYLYLAVMAVLILAGLLPYRRVYSWLKPASKTPARPTDGDKAPRGE